MLRIIKGKTRKSKLFEDLCTGSKSRNNCWISYGHNINPILPANLDSWTIKRHEKTKNNNEELLFDLKILFDKIKKVNHMTYNDIYLYGNFNEDEIDTLEELCVYLAKIEPDNFPVRLNITVQTEHDYFIIEERTTINL